MNKLMTICGAVCLSAFCLTGNAAQQVQMVQINVSGGEFAEKKLPGKPGYDYIFPSATTLDAWKAKGITVIRLPILWQRLQPVINSPFDETYAKLIDQTLKLAADRSMSVIVDLHNFGSLAGKAIGGPDVPLSAYGNLMSRMAQRWAGNPGLNGYDIMNEPHSPYDADWPTVAQKAITEIRRYDTAKPIYVEGRAWSSAANWQSQSNDLLLLRDPNNNLIFSAHLYLDADASGTYKTAPAANFDLDIGVKRATPFVEWLKRNNLRGHIGEFGIPGNDPRWTQAMDRMMAYLQQNCVPLAYWAAGPWWGSYALSIEPQAGVTKAQWATLSKYIKVQTCP